MKLADLNQNWIEFDLNPVITFNNNGKIEYKQ